MAEIRLKRGRDESLRRRHPWVFSGAIAEVRGEPGAGETVELYADDGTFRGRGAYAPDSQIAVRVWTFDRTEIVDAEFFRRRLQRAAAGREAVLEILEPEHVVAGWADGPGGARSARRSEADAAGTSRGGEFGYGTRIGTDAYRLVSAESDGLPGVIVDRYGSFLVVQFLSAGAEAWSQTILDALVDTFGPAGIYERSDLAVRNKEGLEPRTGLVRGQQPPEYLEIVEASQRYLVDVVGGHKTGFYLDQRDNRALLGNLIAGGRHAAEDPGVGARATLPGASGGPQAAGPEVLNAFAYTGGFGICAQAAGAAHVTHIESSQALLELLERNLELNGLDRSAVELIRGDVPQVLRKFRDSRRQFDIIVLDPPKFAESRHQLQRASRGYKDINLFAFKLLRPGGLLLTFSCSGHMEPDLFDKIVADAALDAGRDAQIIRRLTQGPDHPVALTFPEGRYLKGLVCRVC